MADAPELPAQSADVERRIVSVLFADLVGFTTLSETLDAEDVASIQDAYFSAARETAQRYGGVVEKFIGDAAMAVFGAPRARDDDAERAVRAGLALIGAIEQLEARLGMSPGTLMLRVGVNTGEVVHATSGPDAGRVTGDTVNTAARLQTAARPGTVLIGELTALSVAETIESEPIGTVELKGKADPVRAWEAVGARAQPSREEALGALRAPMLGRDAEMGRLQRALDRVARERIAERIVIVAPPGVGKSRLLTELAAEVRPTAVVRVARVRPQATAPYETVAQLFAGVDADLLPAAMADAGVSPERAAVIGEEVRRLGMPSSPPTGQSGDLAAERESRFDAWSTALDAISDRPEMWLVEDVHWAGGDLLAFLDYAGRVKTRHGRLVIATARPSLLEAASAWSDTDRIDLGPLPTGDAEALVVALIGDALPEALLWKVVERSDGTPLFIEELIRTWASVGVLVHGETGWTLAAPPEAVPLPPTVLAIYAAQLDDLPADARAVARHGAVAGRRIPVDALEPLGIDARDGLDALHRRAFVAGPLADPITGEAFAYRHALLRDAGYASLARAERTRLHLAMAAWLESVAGERANTVAEAVAEHYASALESLPAMANASLPRRDALASAAANWFERAGDAALALSAPNAAARLLARSIALTHAEATVDLARRRLRLGAVLVASADMESGVGEMEAALELSHDDPDALEAAAYALGRAYMQQIRFEEADALAGTTLDLLAGRPPAALARLQALRAWAISAQGRADGVVSLANGAWDAARSSGDAALEVDVLLHRVAALDEVGEGSDEAWVQLHERALAVGRWQEAIIAGRMRAVREVDTNPRAALPGLIAATDLAAAHGLTEQVGWGQYSLCEALWLVGDWDAATEAGLAAVELAERYAYQRLGFRTWVVLLPIAAARRDASLVEAFEKGQAHSPDPVPPSASPYARMLHGAIDVWVAQGTGREVPNPSASLVDAVVPFSNPHFLFAIETVVDAWLSAGESDAAASVTAAMAEHATEADATVLAGISSALLRGWQGEPDQARVAADRAAAFGAPWWELRGRRALGQPTNELEALLGIH